jgi:hypothetical protein
MAEGGDIAPALRRACERRGKELENPTEAATKFNHDREASDRDRDTKKA